MLETRPAGAIPPAPKGPPHLHAASPRLLHQVRHLLRLYPHLACVLARKQDLQDMIMLCWEEGLNLGMMVTAWRGAGGRGARGGHTQ